MCGFRSGIIAAGFQYCYVIGHYWSSAVLFQEACRRQYDSQRSSIRSCNSQRYSSQVPRYCCFFGCVGSNSQSLTLSTKRRRCLSTTVGKCCTSRMDGIVPTLCKWKFVVDGGAESITKQRLTGKRADRAGKCCRGIQILVQCGRNSCSWAFFFNCCCWKQSIIPSNNNNNIISAVKLLGKRQKLYDTFYSHHLNSFKFIKISMKPKQKA